MKKNTYDFLQEEKVEFPFKLTKEDTYDSLTKRSALATVLCELIDKLAKKPKAKRLEKIYAMDYEGINIKECKNPFAVARFWPLAELCFEYYTPEEIGFTLPVLQNMPAHSVERLKQYFQEKILRKACEFKMFEDEKKMNRQLRRKRKIKQ